MKQCISILLLITFFCSCISYRDIVNFRQESKMNNLITDSIQYRDRLKLQTDDIIQVIISSYNEEEANKFNLILNSNNNQNVNALSSSVDPFGYRIDQEGKISLPVVGDVKLIDLTLEEAEKVIKEKIKLTNYLNDVSVNIRFLSFRLTVLGEVNNPGSFTIPTQSINILEALGLAKDVTLFSKRNNITIIREFNGLKQYGKIDITSKDLFNSPWYELKPNDIVYVEPHKAKILAAPDPASRYVSTGIAIVSLVLLLLRF